MIVHDDYKDGPEIRRIVTAMVVSRKALSRIGLVWKDKPFMAKWPNVIGQWCIDYFRKHGKAPRNHIEAMLATWSAKQRDESTVKLVSSFLATLSGEHVQLAKEINPEFAAQQAAEHFTKNRLIRLKEGIDAAISAGETTKASELVDEFRKVEVGDGAEVDFFHNDDAIISALNPEKSERLIEYPGALGEFFGPALSRNQFVAFMGREGIGKSWVLMDLAWQAVMSRKRTIYFSIGDMDQDQTLRRFASRAAKAPIKARKIKYPISLEPVNVQDSGVRWEEQEFDKDLDVPTARKALRQILENELNTDKDYLKVRSFPGDTLSLDMLRSILDGLVWQQDWLADVVILDYADVMALPTGRMEMRDQINQLWVGLRRISSTMHNLIITATQINRLGYGVPLITMKHISEEKRKLAHVSAMYGLNQMPEEKHNGVMRLNTLKLREDDFSFTRCVWTAGALGIANPFVLSAWPSKDFGDKDDEEDDDKPSRASNQNGKHKQRGRI